MKVAASRGASAGGAHIIRLALLGTLLLAGAGSAQIDCSSCHDHGQRLEQSVHATVGCQGCHTGHEEYPHPQGIPQPECATCHEAQAGQHALSVHGEQLRAGNAAAPECATCHGSAHDMARATSAAFRKAVPETCGMCHTEAQTAFTASVHGTAVAQDIARAPVCTDCHGEHTILSAADRASPVHPSHVRDTCARCHDDLRLSRRFGLPTDRITSFDASFHGLAARAGSQTVANCASCHGYHDILPSSDPESKTHAANLGETCGSCHPGAGRRFAIGTVHTLPGGEEHAAVRWARWFYLIVIPLTIGFMLLHHGGDWLRKLLRLRLAAVPMALPAASPTASGAVRMYPWERIQHGLLVVSFAVLVWSGFALRYPDQWWALPLAGWEQSLPLRGTIHRIAGAVLIGVAAMHLVSLAVSPRLRRHWMELLPRRGDLAQAFQGLFYNLGLGRGKPRLGAHGYVEKIEYWAVVWGTALMAVTGLMLWANNFMLAWLPKVWLDFASTVHFYEAVLATLAILVWHFYTVIFDPDVYPMDAAWLTGRSPRPAHASSEPDESAAAKTPETAPAKARTD